MKLDYSFTAGESNGSGFINISGKTAKGYEYSWYVKFGRKNGLALVSAHTWLSDADNGTTEMYNCTHEIIAE